MKSFIHKYKNFSFEERTIFSAKFSIIFNTILGISKIILSFFKGVFFLVAGVLNIFILMAKLECYLGVSHSHKKTFKYRNNFTGVFMILAGVQYAIYMGRMLYADVDLTNYGVYLSIGIATVSFIEMAVAVIGCFKVNGKGHYYRNLKVINLCSAMTSIVLTEVALMTFASDSDPRLINGIFGLVVGLLISILGIFIIIAPKVSINDHEHNVYKIVDFSKMEETIKTNKIISLQLTNSKYYRNLYYEATIVDDIIDGHINKGKWPIKEYNIFLLILLITLSEILIFPYAFFAVVNYFKNSKVIKKLDYMMSDMGCVKIESGDDEC